MTQDRFLKFFPVPKYLQFPAVGLDLSDGTIKFLELIQDSGGIRVGMHGRRPYSEGEIISVLSDIQRRFSFDMVNVSIPEEDSFFVRIRLPFIKPSEIRGAVELQLEEYIPYSANEVEFDYEVLKTDPRPSGYVDVNVSVLPKKVLRNYLEIFQKARIQPISLTIEAEATSRATVAKDDKGVVMVVNIGRVNTVLSIIKNGAVWVSYTFKFGGDVIVKRLQEICQLSVEDAERAKNEKGLINSSENQEIFGCLLPMVSSVRDEIRRHRLYWSEHGGGVADDGDSNDISRVIICGSQAIIPGFRSYLSTALNIDVILANPWINLIDFDEYIPPLNHKDSLEYATAIGLAMASFK